MRPDPGRLSIRVAAAAAAAVASNFRFTITRDIRADEREPQLGARARAPRLLA